MLYTEPIPKKSWWMLVLALAALMYLPFLGLRELQATEALRVAAAAGLRADGNILGGVNLGDGPVPMFPLYTWLVALGGWLGLGPEWSVRLPSVLGVVVLAGVCGRKAARAGGHLAGAVAAAAAAGTVLMLGEGRQGSAHTLVAALLTAGWFYWYRQLRVRRNWAAAWLGGPLFAAAAFLAVGIMGPVYFYLPLFFLRRPLRVWPRFWTWTHMLTLLLLAALALVWENGLSGQTMWTWRSPAETAAVDGYLAHYLLYPFRTAAALLPWALLAWPGVCAAFRAVERTPILCRFLRMLVIVLFFGGWLLPDLMPLAPLLLAGPLAVLTGIHAAVLLRRHHDAMRFIPRWLAVGALAAGGAAAAVAVLGLAGVVEIAGADRRLTVLCLSTALTAAAGGAWMCHASRKGGLLPYWMRLAGATAALALAVLAFYPAGRALFYEGHRENAAVLASGLPGDVAAYKIYRDYLVREVVYLGRPVQAVATPEKLPADVKELYVLAGAKPPILETRSWTPCSPPVYWRRHCRPLWVWHPRKGCLLRLERGDFISPEDGEAQVLRMYRGTLKPAVEKTTKAVPETPAPAAAPAKEPKQ